MGWQHTDSSSMGSRPGSRRWSARQRLGACAPHLKRVRTRASTALPWPPAWHRGRRRPASSSRRGSRSGRRNARRGLLRGRRGNGQRPGSRAGTGLARSSSGPGRCRLSNMLWLRRWWRRPASANGSRRRSWRRGRAAVVRGRAARAAAGRPGRLVAGQSRALHAPSDGMGWQGWHGLTGTLSVLQGLWPGSVGCAGGGQCAGPTVEQINGREPGGDAAGVPTVGGLAAAAASAAAAEQPGGRAAVAAGLGGPLRGGGRGNRCGATGRYRCGGGGGGASAAPRPLATLRHATHGTAEHPGGRAPARVA